jgi:hypothetical protein
MRTRPRALRVALAVGVVVGTLAGVLGTSALALLLAAPRLFSTGLEPRPEGRALRWLVSPDVAVPATRILLTLLGVATILLAVLIARGARRRPVWRAYAAWAATGGVLTTFALVANWQLAREAGVLAFAVGGAWSALVAIAIARTQPWIRSEE